jgi:hypothetical protein
MTSPDDNDDRRKAIGEQWWPGLLFWVVVVIIFAAINAKSCFGAEVKLAWNPNPEPDIAGYVVLVGPAPGEWTRSIPVGNVTSCVVENLASATLYHFSLKAVNTAGTESAEAPAITATTAAAIPRLSQDGWIATASSAEVIREDNKAANAIDGNPNTLWHTTWGGAIPPHFLRIELPQPALLSRFWYLPRQDEGTNGIIEAFEIETSLDGISWSEPLRGQWAATPAEKHVDLPLVEARFVRLWGLESRAAAAEVSLAGTYVPVSPAPMVRLTVQDCDDLSNWNELRVFEIEQKPRQFFRLKIEATPAP